MIRGFFVLLHSERPLSLTDRIRDSGSQDRRSIRLGGTKTARQLLPGCFCTRTTSSPGQNPPGPRGAVIEPVEMAKYAQRFNLEQRDDGNPGKTVISMSQSTSRRQNKTFSRHLVALSLSLRAGRQVRRRAPATFQFSSLRAGRQVLRAQSISPAASTSNAPAKPVIPPAFPSLSSRESVSCFSLPAERTTPLLTLSVASLLSSRESISRFSLPAERMTLS